MGSGPGALLRPLIFLLWRSVQSLKGALRPKLQVGSFYLAAFLNIFTVFLQKNKLQKLKTENTQLSTKLFFSLWEGRTVLNLGIN